MFHTRIQVQKGQIYMVEVREETELKTMKDLCNFVKKEIDGNKCKECEDKICQAMAKFPEAPEPQNLWGIFLEKEGNHRKAMRHFRASLDLSPTYRPANQNLQLFGELFCPNKLFAFMEEDCIRLENDEVKAHVERIY